MKRYFSLSFLALTAAVAACNSKEGDDPRRAVANADEGVRLDVNDVSFLFPLVDPQGAPQEAELLALRSPGAGGALLDEASFAAVAAGVARPGDRAFPAYDSWRVVAARVDDCAKRQAADAACVPQLRLIVQPVDAGQTFAQDQALHLVYNLPPADFDGLLDELVALKRAASVPTDGAPLHVHPAMRAEGAAGPFATGLKRAISARVGPANLFAVAVMFTTVKMGVFEWRFANGVFQNGAFVQPPLPCTDPARTSMSVFGTGFFNSINAPALCGDLLNEMVDSHPGGKFLLKTPEEQQPAIDAQLRADNPDSAAFGDARCLECHVGQRALARVKGPSFIEPGFDQNPNRFVPPEGVTTTFRSGRLDPNSPVPDSPIDAAGPYEVRAFGYLSGTPSYTVRALNETALVASSLTKRLAERPAPAPAN
jgi:hypothetical protein